MSAIDWFIRCVEYLRREGRVIWQAPVAFSIMLLLAAGLIWLIMEAGYRNKIEGLKDQVASKDATIEALRAGASVGGGLRRHTDRHEVRLSGPSVVIQGGIPSEGAVAGILVRVTATVAGTQSIGVGTPGGEGFFGKMTALNEGGQKFFPTTNVAWGDRPVDIVLTADEGRSFTAGALKVEVVYDAPETKD